MPPGEYDDETQLRVPTIDPYAAEVEDVTAAILDGMPPRVDLAFSRGNVATLAKLDRIARVDVDRASLRRA